MTKLDEALHSYLKRKYPLLTEAIASGQASGNEAWLLDIAKHAYRAGFADGDASGSARKQLSTLLARVHRDGGHYEAEHGMEKAVSDADSIVAELHAYRDTHAQGKGA